ncbi:MAG: DUF3861 domain-containing protein [Nostoc sp. NOS(2021)]|uniref:DUF3861 domain-containing protein n=1 Tax=Nostoc sp. NOS(2021) TaxID=2815407 RepID=UPI0025D8BBDD|nr:DUF3861 domain-containing protein [Nostoc sp. NOS(2021)]MBN3893826.1 DUF3861 domain-containing protein [Nostoc sp. NOS(2021)]
MSTKKNNLYKIQLAELALKDGSPANKTVEFEFENHDDVFHIIELVKTKKLFKDEDKAVEFGIGLKMFSEVLITNQDKDFFKALMPAFGAFMKGLKAYNQG